MRDLIVLRSAGDVRDFVRGLWKTDLFKSSSYIADWVERLSRFPRVFGQMSNDELEYPHFGTWFGLTYLRNYPEATISDLYYLHEIVHAVLLEYDPAPLFTAWHRKMSRAEFSASLETEALVYLGVPGLREISFADEIWADRFLGGRSRLGDSIKDVIRQERYRAMQNPDPMDYSEQQIAAYARQNFEWANIWKLDFAPDLPAWTVVEEHMSAFRNRALTPEAHVEWLKQSGEIPFPIQARLFAQVYWNGKLSYRLRQLKP